MGFKISCWRACYKRYDGANALKYNLEYEPFVIQRVVQKEGNTFVLGAIEDHMLSWSVVGKKSFCQLALTLQEGSDVDWPWIYQLWLRLQGPNSLNRLLGWWWMLVWTQCHQELLGERLVYKLEVFQGSQRTPNLGGVQTFEGMRSKKKQGNLWKWKKEVCNIINTMVVARNNELIFQRLPGHCPT
jgi:hypothetical protein